MHRESGEGSVRANRRMKIRSRDYYLTRLAPFIAERMEVKAIESFMLMELVDGFVVWEANVLIVGVVNKSK